MPKVRARRGRPTVFEGEKIRVSLWLTKDARAVVAATREMLVSQGHTEATEASAIEFLIRQATRPGLVLTKHLEDGYGMTSWEDVRIVPKFKEDSGSAEHRA